MDKNKITKEVVLEALSDVYDPEIPISIVDLGLIYNIDIRDHKDVNIDMTMTVRGCPMHSFIIQQAQKRVEQIKNIGNVNVNLVWDPPWTPDRISKEAKQKLQGGE